jgi:predicted ATPase/transcriptional regulator with XRE-family HTH domain
MADEVGTGFGDLLRRRRRAVGLTQEELAARAGLSARGIADLERGVRRTPRRDTVTLLVRALGGSPEDEAAFFAAVRRTSAPPIVAASLPAHGDPDTEGRDHQGAAAGRTPNNLPTQPTPLLGREAAVEAIVALVRRPDVRLVTLTGTGGIGKTRLAIQAANDLLGDFADGVWFVRLSRLTDPSLVVPTIFETLGLKEVGGQPIAETLRLRLRERSALLVLDNCEHVAAAAPNVADLLEACPAIAVLATSRTALHLRGEHEYLVAPLELPPATSRPDLARTPERVMEYAAAALFVERARAVRADFALTTTSAPMIAEICARLDGLPLAIELAAVRVKLLPPTALLARLEHRLGFLVGGARDLAERQQAMRSTIDWSENLLTPEERVLFHRLGVFAGGCTLEVAEAVCAEPEGAEPLAIDVLGGLGTLVDQSLIQQREEGGESRFGMLAVIREYALERLEASGEAEALRRAHAVYMMALAERAEPELIGPEQGAWLDRLEREHDNLRAALAWATERSEAETGLRLVGALGRFWLARGHLREGRAWVEGLLRLAGGPELGSGSGGAADTVVTVPARVRARALIAGGAVAFRQADSAAAASWLEEGAALARAAGDPRTTVTAVSALGFLARMRGGDKERVAAYFEESLELSRQLGDQWAIAVALGNLGDTLVRQGNLERAATTFAEALARARQAGDPGAIHICLLNLGWVMRLRSEPTQAEALLREGLKLAQDLDDPRRCAEALEMLTATAGVMGQGERAARLLGAAVATRETIGAPQPAEDWADLEQAVAAARAALGEEAWMAAYMAGHALTLEQAVAEALDEAGKTSETA